MVLIGILVVASAITSTNYHSIVDNLLFGMTLLIPLAVLLLLYTHIQIDNGTLRYVNMLFQREAVDIGKIKRIHEGNNMLFFPRTYIYYERNGEERCLRIYNSFSATTMRVLLSDIKQRNPDISIESRKE